MTDLTTIARENQFFNELVNKFFHPKSYFSYRLKKYLDNPLSFTDQPLYSVNQIIYLFIEYLNRSKRPAQELEEVARINGMEGILLSLKTQMIRHDFKMLDQRQLKKAIRNLTLGFLKNLYQNLTENEKSRETLMTYLEIKINLLNLLNNSDRKIKNNLKPHDSNATENFDVSNERVAKPQSENTTTKTYSQDLTSERFNPTENKFEKEISQLLKPLVLSSNEKSNVNHDYVFIKQMHENFSQIHEQAVNYGHEQVEAIAGHVNQLIKILLSMKEPFDQTMVGLIYDAKTEIEKSLSHRQNSDDLKKFLDTVDRRISELNKPVIPKDNHMNRIYSQLDSEGDKRKSFEINAAFHEIPVGPTQKEHKSAIFPGLHAQRNRNEDDNEIEIPGDNEEAELSKIIHEINISPEISLLEEINAIDQADEKSQSGSLALNLMEDVIKNDYKEQDDKFNASIQKDPVIQNDDSQDMPSGEKTVRPNVQDQDEKLDSSINQIFQQEAALYYKILSSAFSQLKNEEKVQMALEDIELASSSLKHMAQKFGMERLAILPELVETISIIANKHVIKIPSAILQGMEDGINLLKGFDVTNIDHKKSLKAILLLLKEFCSKTLSTIQQTTIA